MKLFCHSFANFLSVFSMKMLLMSHQACAKELELDMNKTNLHGGAISLGHPLGASGSRITAHLAHEFHQPGNTNKVHVGAACIGGGQGIALVLERP
jgi:acetyl-CoA acyltransferase 2